SDSRTVSAPWPSAATPISSSGPLTRSTSTRAPRRSSSPAAGSSTSTPRQEPRTSPIHTARHSSASRERRESRRRHHRRGAGRGTDRVRPRPRFVACPGSRRQPGGRVPGTARDARTHSSAAPGRTEGDSGRNPARGRREGRGRDGGETLTALRPAETQPEDVAKAAAAKAARPSRHGGRSKPRTDHRGASERIAQRVARRTVGKLVSGTTANTQPVPIVTALKGTPYQAPVQATEPS